jgi:hypothetical protein
MQPRKIWNKIPEVTKKEKARKKQKINNQKNLNNCSFYSRIGNPVFDSLRKNKA